VRSLAARGLRAATADTASQRESTVALLRSALTDPHPQVRISVVRSLATFRDTANIAALVNLLADANDNVVIATLDALAMNGGGLAAIEAAARAADRPIGIRSAALTALTRAAPDKALAIAAEWLAAPDWLNRLFGLRAMIATRTLTGAAAARQAVQDKDPRVAAAALQFIATTDTVNAPYTLFIEKLADGDPSVRAAALRGLQRRASPADLEPLLRAYERAQKDTVTDAALAAVDALGELARQDVPVDRTFFFRFHKPTDPLLHRRIVERIGPGPWGQARPINTGKPAEYYRGVAHRYLHPDSTAVQPHVRIASGGGEIILGLDPQEAPLTVVNFLVLAQRGYFNNGRWHRVVPNFVLQDGDPRGDGEGGPGYTIRDEINRLRYTRGAVGMALSGPDTGGSQFFITHSPQPHLDGGYTIFGYVISGIGVADRIIQDDPIVRIDVMQ
jgi:cyclophilin family peptidyl-prolyl cis-trans isomerase/HEAT repeat protein